MKIQEVYVGNGRTIKVIENEEVSYYLDLDKLEQLVLEKGEVIVGACDDWFFTAQDVNKEKLEQIKKYRKHILRASCWSKFEVEVDGERQDCTIEMPKLFDKLAWIHGFDDGISKIHFWIPNMYWRMSELGYEKEEEFTQKVDALLKEYEYQVKELGSNI